MFSDFGDGVSVSDGKSLTLSVSGPFAPQVPNCDDNLVMKAANLMSVYHGVTISLDKKIPVAAGLGGGSSDAATVIHLLSQFWRLPLPTDTDTVALGADLPVCLFGKSAIVEGIGELVTAVPPLPEMNLVLVNPRVIVPTGNVYDATREIEQPPLEPFPQIDTVEDLANWLQLQRNDLEGAAIEFCPVIAEMLSAIAQCSNCYLARMSGSGATCFGLFENYQSAAAAAKELIATYPNWWVRQVKA